MEKFVVFEGIDGCGKSTALEALDDYIWKKTLDSIRLGTEPTGFASGELVRKALGGNLEGISSETLLGMFLADRAIHQNEISIRMRSHKSPSLIIIMILLSHQFICKLCILIILFESISRR